MTGLTKKLAIIGLLAALVVFPAQAALAEEGGIPDIIWDWASNMGIDNLTRTGPGAYSGVIVNSTLAEEAGLIGAVDGMPVLIIDEEMEENDVIVRVDGHNYGINRWE